MGSFQVLKTTKTIMTKKKKKHYHFTIQPVHHFYPHCVLCMYIFSNLYLFIFFWLFAVFLSQTFKKRKKKICSLLDDYNVIIIITPNK
jgi:hypothetical protein